MPQQRPRLSAKPSMLDSVFERWYNKNRKTADTVEEGFKRLVARATKEELLEMLKKPHLDTEQKRLVEAKLRRSGFGSEIGDAKDGPIANWLKEHGFVFASSDGKRSVKDARFFIQVSPTPGARWTNVRGQPLSGYAEEGEARAELDKLRSSTPRSIGLRIYREEKQNPAEPNRTVRSSPSTGPSQLRKRADAASNPAREAVEEFYRNAERSGGNAALARAKTKIHFDLSDLKVGSEGNVVSFKVKDRTLSKDAGFANLKFEAEDHTTSWMVFVTLTDGRPYTKINVPKDKAATKAEAIHEAKVMLASGGRDRARDARGDLDWRAWASDNQWEVEARNNLGHLMHHARIDRSEATNPKEAIAVVKASVHDRAMNRDARPQLLSKSTYKGYVIEEWSRDDGGKEFLIRKAGAGNYAVGTGNTLAQAIGLINEGNLPGDHAMNRDAIQTTYYQHVGRTHNRKLAKLRTMMDHNLKILTVDRLGRITDVKSRDIPESQKRQVWLERQKEELRVIEARKANPRPGDKERAEELRYRIKSMQGDADPVQMLKSQIARLEGKLSSAHNAEERRDIKKEIEELRQDLRAASNRDARYEERVLRREIEHLLDNNPGIAPDVTRQEFVRAALQAGHSSPMASAMWDLLHREGFHNFSAG